MALITAKMNKEIRSNSVMLPDGSGGWIEFSGDRTYSVDDSFLSYVNSRGVPYIVSVAGEANLEDLSTHHTIEWFEGQGAVEGELGGHGDRYVETDVAGAIVAFWRKEGETWGDRQLFASSAGAYSELTPSGTSTDNVQINQAISSASAAGGGIVRLSAGTFNISDKIVPANNVAVVGVGMGNTKLRAVNGYTPTPGSVSGYQLVYGNTLSNVAFANLTLDHNEANGTTNMTYVPNSHCLDLRQCTNVFISNVEVLGAIRYSMYIDRPDGALITGNRVLTGQGATSGVSGAREQQDGIHLVSPKKFRVLKNEVTTAGPNDIGDDGIVVRAPQSPDVIAKDGVINGNVIAADQSGIKVIAGGAQNIEGISIVGNEVNDTWGGFVQVEGYSTFTGLVKDIAIVGNVGRNFLGSDTHVIRVSSAASGKFFENVSIIGNIVDGVATRGAHGIIAAHGSGLIVKDNRLNNVNVDNMIVVGQASKPVFDFTVGGNVIDCSTTTRDNVVAINISRSKQGTVSSNVVSGQKANSTTDTAAGIRLIGEASNQVTDVVVIGNNIMNSTAGVQEQTDSLNNVVRLNSTRTCTTPQVLVGSLVSNTSGGDGVYVVNLPSNLPSTGGTVGDISYVRGRTSVGDGAGGTFILMATNASASADDGGINFVVGAGADGTKYRWKRQYDGAINVKWFGALGTYHATNNPTGDDSAAFLLWATFLKNQTVTNPIGSGNKRGTVKGYIPGGAYRITLENRFLVMPGAGARTSGLKIEGDGADVTKIYFDPADSGTDKYLMRNAETSPTANGWLALSFYDMAFIMAEANSSVMLSDSFGGPQDYMFTRCKFNDYKYGVHLKGSDVNSEFSFYGCSMHGTTTHFLYSQDSDQFLNYWCYGVKFEVDKGNFCRMTKGGNLHIEGGSFIQQALQDYSGGGSGVAPITQSEGTFFKLEGAHASGVETFTCRNVRFEQRNSNTLIINSTWTGGTVKFDGCDFVTFETEAYAAAMKSAIFDMTNTHGPIVKWTDCRIMGKHEYIYGSSQQSWMTQVVYDSTVHSGQTTPEDTIVYTDFAAHGVTTVRTPITFRNARTSTTTISNRSLTERVRLRSNQGTTPVTLNQNSDGVQIFTGNLTANIVVDPPSAGRYNGQRFRIIRQAGGAFTLTVTLATNKVFASSTTGWVDIVWDGSAWQNMGAGTL